MSIELSQIYETTLPTAVEVGAHTIEVEYRIGALGPEFDAWLYSADGGLQPDSIYAAIERTCTYLGILIDGAPIPVTAEALKQHKVPTQVLHAILAQVRSEARVGKLGTRA